jgi:hypothetical protein
MTSRQILFKHTKELTPLLESVQRNIEIIKDIKDSLPDLDDQLRLKEIETERRIETFDRQLKDHKLETITKVANELGKMIISPADMEELVNEIKIIRSSIEAQVKEKAELAVVKFKQDLTHQVQINDLLHEKEIAVLNVLMKTKDDEIQSLKNKYENKL